MSAYFGDYRDLGAWREAILLLAEIHLLVKTFPEHERPHLGERMYRAAVDVPAHIAEGHERDDRREFLEHLETASARLSELNALLVTSEQLGYISPVILQEFEMARRQVASPLRGLINKVHRGVAALESTVLS